MISETFTQSVYIADFTDFISKNGEDSAPFHGVVVRTQENGIISSFLLSDENAFPFIVINNERNPALYTREDGSKVSQCECIIYSERNDNRKGWMVFLELKYCQAKNLYKNMLDGIGQLKATYCYLMDEIQVFERSMFKKYLVISTPGVEPLDPFDASYFDQDFILRIKEETDGGLLKASNEAHILTPAVVQF